MSATQGPVELTLEFMDACSKAIYDLSQDGHGHEADLLNRAIILAQQANGWAVGSLAEIIAKVEADDAKIEVGRHYAYVSIARPSLHALLRAAKKTL